MKITERKHHRKGRKHFEGKFDELENVIDGLRVKESNIRQSNKKVVVDITLVNGYSLSKDFVNGEPEKQLKDATEWLRLFLNAL